LEIRVDSNDIEKALKVLKRKLQKEGVMADIKKKVFYEKPSVKMKTKQRQAQKKRLKTSRLKRQTKKD
jgi:small subunit ribosomal protein S21